LVVTDVFSALNLADFVYDWLGVQLFICNCSELQSVRTWNSTCRYSLVSQ